MNQCCEKCVYSSPWGLYPCKCHKPEEEGHPTDTTLEGLLKEVVDLFGFDNKEGTYWHILTRVKEARQVGTLTIDDYQEVTDEDIQPILDFITKAYTLGQANGRKAEREEVEGKAREMKKKTPLGLRTDLNAIIYNQALENFINYLTKEGE